ncbi:hypothetical protein BGX27_007623 [Mortierella sp. AM989]|nr:hypothetical protein BGX27_007623 [Mortierella sp. AM989]
MSEYPKESTSILSKLRPRKAGGGQPTPLREIPPPQMGCPADYMRPVDFNPLGQVTYQHSIADHRRPLEYSHAPQYDHMRPVVPILYPPVPVTDRHPQPVKQPQPPVFLENPQYQSQQINHLRILASDLTSIPQPPHTPSRLSTTGLHALPLPSGQQAPNPRCLLVSENDIQTRVKLLSATIEPTEDEINMEINSTAGSAMRGDSLFPLSIADDELLKIDKGTNEVNVLDKEPLRQSEGMVKQTPLIALHNVSSTGNYDPTGASNYSYYTNCPSIPDSPDYPQNQSAPPPSDPRRIFNLNNNKEIIEISPYSTKSFPDPGIEYGAKKRWYLRQIGEVAIGKLSKTPLSPLSVPASQDWKCLLDIATIEKGWYSMVFCISFKSTSTNPSDTLTIDAKQLDQGKRAVYMGKKCKTIAGHSEIRTISRVTPTRLRLYRQIELQAGGWIEATINLGLSDLSSCELHYVELDYGQADPGDCILYGEGKPQKIISVERPSNELIQKTLGIHSVVVSSVGGHALTLCFEDGLATYEVWALHESPEQQYPPSRGLSTRPYARGSLTAKLANHPDLRDICLSVSNSGQQVVLHSNELSLNGMPCHIFRCSSYPRPHYTPSESFDMEELPPPKGLNGFFGQGTFHSYISKVSGELKERYITCDGKSVCIYIPLGNWSMESEMKLGSEPHLEAALGVMQSLRGQFFAWTGEKGVVSIWDLESRRQISYIHVEGSSLGASASISSDGSLVAISVKGRISVHETISGVKLGEYKEGLGEEKFFEVILEKDYFMLLDHDPLKDTNSDIAERKIVRISDMSVVKTFPIHKDYSLQFPSTHSDQVFLYSQGSVANIIRMSTDVVSSPEAMTYDDRSMQDIHVENFSHSNTQDITSSSGTTFHLATSVSVIHGNWMTVLKITRNSNIDGGGEPEKSLTIPLGSSHALYSRIFMPNASRLAIVTGRYLQVWKLLDGTGSSEVAKLELIWALVPNTISHRIADICIRQVSGAMADDRGEQFVMLLQPPQWFRRLKELPRDNFHSNLETITYPVSGIDTLSITEEYRVAQGIRGAVDMYMDGDTDCKSSVVRYLKTLVRPSPKNTVSCIVALCHYWNPEDRTYFEQMMTELLPADQITWVPNAADSSKDMAVRRYGHEDPLALLLKMAETQPAAIGVAKVVMDYCVNHANSSKNLAFLSPIFGSMHEVMTLFPEEALECLSRIAFIPAKQRSYIIDNHIIVHPPKFRLQFWKPVQQQLCDTTDPIMQLHVSPTKPNASNDKFTHPVFMASFDALWFYHDASPAPVDGVVTTKSGSRKDKHTEIEMTRIMTASTMRGNSATTIQQAFQGWSRYKVSTYNILDVFSFLVPMAASVDQLVVISQDDPHGNVRLLSFSVLIVFLHMLFELRIYESVCKYVTIIQQAILEIKVFFVIFAAGIVAFSIGMLHLLHGCGAGVCPKSDSTFTRHFFGALSSTYFFMGGRYDPISDKFDSDDWAFHIMMIVYFFFTVILMLNVLIALVNVAFTKGDDGWRLAWVESRLRYIESAENMSYHIPGYRQTRSWFPKEIYFTATKQQVNTYKEKYGLKESAMGGRDGVKMSGSAKDKTLSMVDTRVEELQRQLVLQQERMERQMQDLKDLLVQSFQNKSI